MTLFSSPRSCVRSAVRSCVRPITGAVTSPYLLNENLTSPAQYVSGGWLKGLHSRASTATYVDSGGLIATAAIDEPRLHHDSAGNPLGYLHEPQATNHLPYYIPDSNWVVSTATVTEDAAVSPSGASDASLITGTGTFGRVRDATGVLAAGDYCGSIYLKAGTGHDLRLELRDFGGGIIAICDVDLDAGTVTPVTGTAGIEDAGSGWYRVFFTDYHVTGPARVNFQIRPGVWGQSFTDNFYCWGCQLEDGTAPTSLIPTSGAETTRAVDALPISIPSGSDGTAYVTYGDGGSATFAVTPGGSWDLPTDLDDTYARIQLKP